MFNTSKKILSDPEECVLVDLVLESADCGLPLTCSALCTSANAVIAHCDGEEYKPSVRSRDTTGSGKMENHHSV